MRSTFAIAAFLASITSVIAAGSEGFISSQKSSTGHNSTEAKEIIVLYEKDEALRPELKDLLNRIELDHSSVIRELNNSQFGGVILKAGSHCADALNAMPEVAMVEEKVAVKTYATQKTSSPWGLQRISNAAGASGDPTGQDFTYSFDDANLGAGVDVYVVDTGVRTSHAVFQTTTDGTAAGSRVKEGVSFTNTTTDGDGHGTHTAGTAVGAKFGVAQGANVIAVKVLGDDGSGSSSDTISGMDWVINRHNSRKGDSDFKGSVMSMSWGLQGTSASVDQVIISAVEAGIHVSVAAGNDGADACADTPSHNGGSTSAVVSVGAVDINNKISSFSNTGKCVDVYAPGEQVLSSWNTGDTIINFLSGTSMACPHVSGVMAYLLAKDTAGTFKTDPAALKAELLKLARQSSITGSTNGGASLLASNGVDGGVAAKRLMRNWVVPDHSLDEKRTVVGSPASWAKDVINNLGKRWELHSTESTLRF